jgi:hypothetical protein
MVRSVILPINPETMGAGFRVYRAIFGFGFQADFFISPKAGGKTGTRFRNLLSECSTLRPIQWQ